MVLGHNLDSERGFAQSVARGSENLTAGTWRALTEFLGESTPGDITLSRCFFTNFLIGLIPGASATGAFPGAKDPAFVERCRAFLNRQIEVLRPSLLLVLGRHTPRLLAPLCPRLGRWANATTFADIDRDDGAVIYDARIAGVGLSVVALTHPSYRRLNVRCRRFQGLSGEAAELEMMRRVAIAGRDRVPG
jgi:uracil-DNA glycosylase